MKDFNVFINTFVGVDKVIKIIHRVAKVKGMEDVYREMMADITAKQNVAPWGDINKYANKMGVIVFHGDMPKSKGEPQITGLYATGRILKRMLGIAELKDDKKYFFDGMAIYEI